tara:strand:- start:55 stop:468 length:414 start_codon:yes stop_codon:yes gene_type:complete
LLAVASALFLRAQAEGEGSDQARVPRLVCSNSFRRDVSKIVVKKIGRPRRLRVEKRPLAAHHLVHERPQGTPAHAVPARVWSLVPLGEAQLAVSLSSRVLQGALHVCVQVVYALQGAPWQELRTAVREGAVPFLTYG